MRELSVNKFRANIKSFVDQSISEHEAIRVRRRAGKDSIVMSAENWDREQETLYVCKILHKNLCKILKEMQHGDPSNGLSKPEQLIHN